MMQLSPLEALQLVRAAFKTEADMAMVFGVTQPTVNRWLNVQGRMPAEYVLRAEAHTGVSRHLLRPDIYPVESAPPVFTGIDRRLAPVAVAGAAVPARHSGAAAA